MSFLQPWMLIALPLMGLPILIHLINQQRYQTRRWGAMMFLMTATRMNRGFARIRQWIILALRTLAVAALILTVARPLASGLVGISGGKADTTIVISDRSPSMNQIGQGGLSKLQTGRQQLQQTLSTLGSNHWVGIDSTTKQAIGYGSLDELMTSSMFQPASSTSDMPGMLRAALSYLQDNRAGPTEIWICSDAKASDWQAQDGTWSLIREEFQRLPHSVRFHLLVYPEPAITNLSVKVTEARLEQVNRESGMENNLVLSVQVTRTSTDPAREDVVDVPLQIEIEGQPSMVNLRLTGPSVDLKEHRIALAKGQLTGWGMVSIPADAVNADNVYYFAFEQALAANVLVVSENREATRALEIAAAVSADGSSLATVDVLSPEQLDSLALDETSLLLWQAALPEASLAPAIVQYLERGGQAIFFPPSPLPAAITPDRKGEFVGVSWGAWQTNQVDLQVESWRGDQDLLAATEAGMGLPVGELVVNAYAQLNLNQDKLAKSSSNAQAYRQPNGISVLAKLANGDPLLVRVPVDRGGLYFCTTSPAPNASSLATEGVVLYVALQRAIQQGRVAVQDPTQMVAGEVDQSTKSWRKVSGTSEALSTEFGYQAGVYQVADRWVAVNRSWREDDPLQLSEVQLQELFADLPFSMVREEAGSLSGLVREIWRLCLIAMIIALLVEAALCLPRQSQLPTVASRGSRAFFASQRTPTQ